MKKLFPPILNTLVLVLIITTTSIAQVGIGNTDPKTQLEVDGALSLREGAALALSNGANTDINLGATPYSFYRITGPTAAFSIGSIYAETGADGQIITLINTTTFPMTITHSLGNARRIYCPTETDIIITGRYATVTLQYNTSESKWFLVNSMGGSDDWKLTGNAGTTAGTNFIGTTDNVNVTVRRNNLERVVLQGSQTVMNPNNEDVNFRVRTQNSGNTFFVDGQFDNVGIGTLGTIATTKLEVDGGTTDGIFGYSNNVGGYLGRETNISFGTPVQTLSGAGVYASNPNAGYTSTFSQSTGAADVAANINFSEVWIGSYNYVESSSAIYNPSAVYAQLNVTNSALGGWHTPISTYSNRGTTAGNPWYTLGLNAQSIAQNEDAFGIRAIAFSDRVYSAAGDVAGASFFVGDYVGNGFSNAWVANYFGFTDYKIVGSGAVSTLIKDENNIARVMYAPEAPEVLFQDFGVGTLVNGRAEIRIDPILAKNIHVSPKHPLKVFIQLEGDCNGVYVTNKSSQGFSVVELQGGNSNIDFSWQLVANRKDRKGDSDFGDSNFQDVRLPKFIKKGGFKETIENSDVSNKKRK